MNGRQFQFEWSEANASANLRKHSIAFDVAASVFNDPQLLTVPPRKHSEIEDHWFSLGCDRRGDIIAISYLWSHAGSAPTRIRLLSARRATPTEVQSYRETQ